LHGLVFVPLQSSFPASAGFGSGCGVLLISHLGAPQFLVISGGLIRGKPMSDKVIMALVTGGFMLAAIGTEKLFVFLAERNKRAKEFFKDFFPKRLEAHKKIIRVVTDCGIDYLDPERLGADAIKIVLKNARQRLEAAGYETLLDAEKHVSGALFELSPLITEVTKIDGDLKEKNLFRDVLERLQAKNRELIRLLREQSGVDIIDQEFAKVIKAREKSGKPKGAKTDRGIHSQTPGQETGVLDIGHGSLLFFGHVCGFFRRHSIIVGLFSNCQEKRENFL
jgi:hypothetical protein